jgi:NAD(P)-dependent dehydrogenase (short-subunit alcohol dehydrogenase family)
LPEQRPPAVVTGGSRGIARAFVNETARRGFDIVFSYRNRDADAVKTVELPAADISSWPDASRIVVLLDGGRIM